jgi:hypothetical protein
MYRDPASEGEEEAEVRFVTVRRYLDAVVAQADRAHLQAVGIRAHVIEAASINPLLAGALGGVTLEVAEHDLRRAEQVLAESTAPDPQVDDGEGEDAVRCPRCELAYCSFERPTLRGLAPGAVGGLALVLVGLRGFGGKRWCCQRCGHLWDDPKEGPKAMTPLGLDDPRPVFRLRRAHAGMGLFLGLILGFLGLVSLGPLLGGAALLVALGVVPIAWLVGSRLRYDVCSEPSCRAPLLADAEECERCHGAIAGVVRTAEEHYSAAADFRRELAELKKRPAKISKKAKKARKAKRADLPAP